MQFDGSTISCLQCMFRIESVVCSENQCHTPIVLLRTKFHFLNVSPINSILINGSPVELAWKGVLWLMSLPSRASTANTQTALLCVQSNASMKVKRFFSFTRKNALTAKHAFLNVRLRRSSMKTICRPSGQITRLWMQKWRLSVPALQNKKHPWLRPTELARRQSDKVAVTLRQMPCSRIR